MQYVTPGLTTMLRHQVDMFLLHTYTRTPRGIVTDNTGTVGIDESTDAWGEQVYAPSAPVTLQSCLYLEEGQTVVLPNGLIEVARPLLLVPNSDPILEGDSVSNIRTKDVVNPVLLLLGPVIAEEVTLIAPEFGGALYKTFMIRQITDI